MSHLRDNVIVFVLLLISALLMRASQDTSAIGQMTDARSSISSQ